ncbi:hypothetical protein MXM33_08155 [Acinetobacter vivianii]|uniref:hypothetical protein n=1 Tax=Acinetobacter vivianii TaxID=1776742 RepID=UPI002DB98755|nr:hypothetical protein [Acinetobacter vivianii]MEB6667004.1 hypothetical protein [Acinetobacter vivianii]
MIKLTIDLKSGHLFVNGSLFNFFTEDDYLESVRNIPAIQKKPLIINGFHKYGGFELVFLGRVFAPEFVYKNNKLYKKYFIWGEGECNELEWESSEDNLKNDRKKLISELTLALNKKPDKKLKYSDYFVFDWGEIRISINNRDFYVLLNFDYY